MTVESVAALREEIWDAGFRPVPVVNCDRACTSPGKKPGGPDGGREWEKRAKQDPPIALRWRDPLELNTGILCDGLRPIDVDVEDATIAARIRATAIFMLGEAPMRVRDNSARCLLLYRAAEGEPHKRKLEGAHGKVEILGVGNQFVAYGLHPSGSQLRWLNDEPRNTLRDSLPAVTEQQIDAFLAEVGKLLGQAAETQSTTQHETAADVRALIEEIKEAGAADVTSAADLPQPIRDALDTAIATYSRLSARWNGDVADLQASGRDASRSGRDMSLAAMLKGAGLSDTAAAVGLLAFEHGAAHDVAKHPTQWTRLRYVARTALRSSIASLAAEPAPLPPDIDPETGEVLTPSQTEKAGPLWVDAGEWDEEQIPKRPWLAPGYLMRNAVSALSGQGSGGKSSLTVCWTISLATGEAIGEFRPTKPCVVVNYNVEDDEYEQRRRYSAALIAAGKAPADVAGKVIRCGPASIGTLFERHPATGHIAPTNAMVALEALCKANKADVLVCDPLAELHNAEENDNTAMRSVVAAFRGLAQRLNMSVLLLHHDRKGNNAPGDMDRLRGASAITGAVRVLMTLTSMSTEEAEQFGIPAEERRRHFRIDGAKSNYAVAQEAEWWKLAAFALKNGEEVAACRPWAPPSMFDGLSMLDCVAILDALSRPLPSGRAWGFDSRANDEWAGSLIIAKGKNKKQAGSILKAWRDAGTITVGKGDSSRRGHERDNVTDVDLAAIAEMRRGIKGARTDAD